MNKLKVLLEKTPSHWKDYKFYFSSIIRPFRLNDRLPTKGINLNLSNNFMQDVKLNKQETLLNEEVNKTPINKRDLRILLKSSKKRDNNKHQYNDKYIDFDSYFPTIFIIIFGIPYYIKSKKDKSKQQNLKKKIQKELFLIVKSLHDKNVFFEAYQYLTQLKSNYKKALTAMLTLEKGEINQLLKLFDSMLLNDIEVEGIHKLLQGIFQFMTGKDDQALQALNWIINNPKKQFLDIRHYAFFWKSLILYKQSGIENDKINYLSKNSLINYSEKQRKLYQESQELLRLAHKLNNNEYQKDIILNNFKKFLKLYMPKEEYPDFYNAQVKHKSIPDIKKRVVLRIWPSSENGKQLKIFRYGHVSIETEKSYLSYYGLKHMKFVDNFQEEMKYLGIFPEKRIVLYSLDFNKINEYIYNLKNKEKVSWSLYATTILQYFSKKEYNCASVAYECLQAGGINKLATIYNADFHKTVEKDSKFGGKIGKFLEPILLPTGLKNQGQAIGSMVFKGGSMAYNGPIKAAFFTPSSLTLLGEEALKKEREKRNQRSQSLKQN